MAQEWVCHILNGLTNHYLSFYLWSWMGNTLVEVTRAFALVRSGIPWFKIHFHVVHALAALVLPPFLPCTVPQCSSAMCPVMVSSGSRGCACGHSPVVSCCAGYGKAALRHAKSHSSSAWFCGEYFGCNFMTNFNHLRNGYFLSQWKKNPLFWCHWGVDNKFRRRVGARKSGVFFLPVC